ncbi:uncharacterized protein LOC112843172 [Scomber scombrus]|uniref:Uncharacterized protein LOC112843172 n=1 Tax=Scomber scombrus TaxID=13677 RepID=A0AAV1PVS9_SCOSC
MEKCPKPPKSSSKCVVDAKAYREGLGPQEKERYLEKLRFIGGADPYELASSSWINDDPESLPSIAYPDIVNYLVFSPSPYTAEDLKSYKSLEAYNQMVCGWVREMQYQVINDRCHIKWFHYSCINIKVAPKGKWYCPECQKLPQFQPKKGKKPYK